MPPISKAIPNVIIAFLAYDILSQSNSSFTSSTLSIASCRKYCLLGFVSFQDHCPSIRKVFAKRGLQVSSVFFASHCLVQASFTFEIMNVFVG